MPINQKPHKFTIPAGYPVVVVKKPVYSANLTPLDRLKQDSYSAGGISRTILSDTP